MRSSRVYFWTASSSSTPSLLCCQSHLLPFLTSGRITLQLEDLAAVGIPAWESALRQNLSMSMSDRFDDQAINGNGMGNNLTGILQRLGAGANPGAAAATWDELNGYYADVIDGLWAMDCMDVGMLVGVASYRLAVRAFRDYTRGDTGIDVGDVSFAAYAMKYTGGLRTSS